jgi:subtilase family serine protease
MGFSPLQIRAAYGINQVVFGTTQGDGIGQTIAIVDSYDDPNLFDITNSNFSSSDLARFDQEFNLADPPNFSVLNQFGTDIGTSGYNGPRPAKDLTGAGEATAALDVEWAHAIAPGANIVLIECNSASPVDLFTGVTIAKNLPGVSVVSIGGGFGEDITLPIVDNALITPIGHQGVTFVAPTGDLGTPGWYPAYSSNVVAVGGTTLALNPLDFAAPYVSEQGWSGSGGGTSNFESEPGYQLGVHSTGVRTVPDVSFDADPSTGVAVYDSYNNAGLTPWNVAPVGGTSLAATGWAGLIAIADQGRVAAGGTTLDGPTQTLPALYSLPASDFHDNLGGDNGTNDNGLVDPAIYNEVTGLGTPQANVLVNDLDSSQWGSQLVVTAPLPPVSVSAGVQFGFTVTAEDRLGTVETSFNGNVTVALASNPEAGTLDGTLTVKAVNGVAVFAGLSLDKTGHYTFTFTNGYLTSPPTSVLSVTPEPVAQLAVTTQPPASVTAGVSFGLTVSAEDIYGNVETSFGKITVALFGSTVALDGTVLSLADDGVASFTGLSVDAAGVYTLQAIGGGLTSPPTTDLTVTPAPLAQLKVAFPASVIAGRSFELIVSAEDVFGNTVTTFGSSVNIALATAPPGGVLSGPTTVAAIQGVAAFQGLILNTDGDYTFQVSGSGLMSVTTSVLSVTPAPAAQPLGYTPAQIRLAYGIDQVAFGTLQGDGSGQTIAIVDAYDDPDISNDVVHFSQEFNLPPLLNFTVLNQYGATGPAPVTDPTGAWEGTEALDVEWAHAIAPGANIVLIECNSASPVDLFTGVTTAKNLPGVSVVSIGGGFGEDTSLPIVDNALITPSGHQGVTFVAPTGDSGTPGWYPAYSSNVVAVGGTTLTLNLLDFAAPYVSEKGWSNSGGGISSIEAEPGYQLGVQNSGKRTIPDVSFDADPSTGVAVYDSYNNAGLTPWEQVGGTSLAATGWAGLIAIADQGRIAVGGTTLDGPTQTLPALYSLPTSDFHDNLGGDNGTNDNGLLNSTRYNEVTGLGTPQANVLVNDLASYELNIHLVVSTQPPHSVIAGNPFGLTISVEDPFGNLETSFNGSVTVAFGSNPGDGPLRGTLIATTVMGKATFSGLSINTATTGYTLQVTGVGLSVATTNFINVTPGAATQLAVTTQPPASVAVDGGFGLIVAVEDIYGNVETGTSSGIVTLALDNYPIGAQLSGVNPVTVVNGVAVFDGMTINTPSTDYKLIATSGGLTITTAPFDVTHAATQLAVTSEPPASVVAGSSFGLTVAVEDVNGDVVPSFNGLVTISGAGDPGGILTVPAVNGVATFIGLSLDRAGASMLDVTSIGLIPATTGSINVTPASLQQLVVTTQPPLFLTAGTLFGLIVSAEDIYGNVETSFYDSITVALFNNPTVALQGTLTKTASQGVAIFTGLELDSVGSGYKLDVSGGGQDTKTNAFSVTPAPATRLAVSTQPPGTLPAGSGFGMAVSFEDAYGNLATTFGGSVTVASAPLGITGATTVNAVQGVASFSGLALDTVGAYSLQVSSGALNAMTNAVNVTPGPTAQLVVTPVPAGTVTAGSSFGLTVSAADAFGNPTTLTGSVTVAVATGPGVLGGGPTTVAAVAGAATFAGLVLDTAGTGYTLQVSNGVVTGTTPLIVIPALGEQLAVITAPPGTVAAGSIFGLTVTAEDAFGNVATTFGGSVTVMLANNPGAGALGGTKTVTAVHGIAVFGNLSINTAGTGYTIQAVSGQTSTTTGPVNVTPPATQLAVTSQPPPSFLAGSLFGLTVSVEDAGGRVVSSFNGNVTIALGSNPAGGNLSGTLSVPAVNGVATFTGLSLAVAGSYTITASSGQLTVATTDASNVTPIPLPELAVFAQSNVVTAGTYFELTVDVENLDGGNPPQRVTLTLINNPGGATFGGNLSLAVINGQVTFYGLTLNVPGSGYTIEATSTGFAPATTSPITVVSPAATRLVVSAQPAPSVVANGKFGLTIAVDDASGNLVTSFNGRVTVALMGKAGLGKLHGTTTVTASNGIARFSGLMVTKAGKGYKLRLTASGLTPTSTSAFKVSLAAARRQSSTPQAQPSKGKRKTARSLIIGLGTQRQLSPGTVCSSTVSIRPLEHNLRNRLALGVY